MVDAIYGPQGDILKGKHPCKIPGHVYSITRSPIQLQIEKEYKIISIIMDYIFINRRPFYLTK